MLVEALMTKGYWKQIKKASSVTNLVLLPLSMTFHIVWVYGLVFGSQRMIQSHAYICNTMYGVFVILIGYVLCIKPNRLELLGLFFTLCGITCMLCDTSAERVDGVEASALDY